MSTIPLPQGMQSFDASTVEPTQPYEPIPTDWYTVKIIGSEMKPTAKGGNYLEIQLEVMEGQHTGRRVWDRLNLINDNPTAVEIAYKTLSAICHATGVIQVTDSSQLHGIPLKARVVLVAPRTVEGKTYDASNDVKGYKKYDGGAAAAPNGSTTPPWTPAAAPAAAKPAAPGWTPPSSTPPPWQAPAPTPVAPPPPPPPVVAAPAFPPEAIEWAKANPSHPQAAEILKTLPVPVTPAPAGAPWGAGAVTQAPPAAPVAPTAPKPPWMK